MFCAGTAGNHQDECEDGEIQTAPKRPETMRLRTQCLLQCTCKTTRRYDARASRDPRICRISRDSPMKCTKLTQTFSSRRASRTSQDVLPGSILRYHTLEQAYNAMPRQGGRFMCRAHH